MDERLTLAASELQLAAENLSAALLVAENGLFRNAVADLYYAAFHTVVALLVFHGIETSSHDGIQTMFGLHFIKPGIVDRNAGKYLGALYHARLTADYKGYLDLDRSDYEEAAGQARLILTTVAAYLREHAPELSLAAIEGPLKKF